MWRWVSIPARQEWAAAVLLICEAFEAFVLYDADTWTLKSMTFVSVYVCVYHNMLMFAYYV